jgi:hypothetical protein
MIPNSRWSCQTKPQEFSINKILPKPDTRYSSVFDIKTGGVELSGSNGSLNSRYWIVYQQSGSVLIRGANDANTWDDPVTLFTESNTIVDISLSFDNLGRPVVFYQKGTELVLWFYDSQIGGISFKTITTDGRCPIVNFDYINETSNPDSDIMMYYVRNDVAYMRLQRDRFDVEYNTGVNYPELYLENSGMTTDNRFQVNYSFRDMRDGSLLHRKCLESDTYILRQMQNNNFTLGFTIALAPSDCELRKLTKDYGTGWNGRFCVADHSGNHDTGGHAHEERLFTLDFVFLDDTPDSDIIISVHRTGFYTGFYLTQQVSNFRFTNGNYILRFTQDAPLFSQPMKRIELIKDSVTIIDQVVPDLESPYGQTVSSVRNRLRFGACTESNGNSYTIYKNLFPAVFTDIYTIVNGTRTDWFKQFSDQFIQSTPSGNPLLLRKKGDDSTYVFGTDTDTGAIYITKPVRIYLENDVVDGWLYRVDPAWYAGSPATSRYGTWYLDGVMSTVQGITYLITPENEGKELFYRDHIENQYGYIETDSDTVIIASGLTG